MTFTSRTIVNVSDGTSSLYYRVNGNPERTLTLGGGGVFHLPPLVAPDVMKLDDFTEVVNGVQRWQERVRAELKFVIATPTTVTDVGFSVGAQGVDGTYQASSSVTLDSGAVMGFAYTPGVGVVFTPRGALDLRWADMATRNALSFDMITAALTGQRPRPGASVIGPRGPAGPSDPLVAWPIDSVLTTKSAVNPAGYLGGTWVLLATGNLMGGVVGTVWAWRRTA